MNRTMLLAFCSVLFISYTTYGQQSLKTKARVFIAALHKSYEYPMGGRDTLIDLNRDGYKDILIEYYGCCGTGLKNRVDIYPYDSTRKRFSKKEKIGLTNPTFYFKTNTIASYYIAYGGGGAALHRWKGNHIVHIEEIDVEVTDAPEPQFIHTLINYRTGKKRKWTDSDVNLPDKYHYYEYVPVIKRAWD